MNFLDAFHLACALIDAGHNAAVWGEQDRTYSIIINSNGANRHLRTADDLKTFVAII